MGHRDDQILHGLRQKPDPFGQAGALAFVDVDAQHLDLASLFFDNTEAAFDKDEYIIRGNDLPGGIAVQSANPITGSTPSGTVTVPVEVASLPMDFTYGSDTIAANQRYTDWYKRMDREEAALFKAMLVEKSDLLGSENDVNITNLAGNALLANNYASYECATQYPNVTIPGAGIVHVPWASVCQLACPTLATIPGVCPFPPGVGADGTGVPEGDQNGVPANADLGTPQVNALGGGLVPPAARLAAYPSVWGGTGAFCVGSGDSSSPSVKDGEGDSYDPALNPFQGSACGGTDSMTASLHGSVFKVGSTDVNTARIHFLTSAGTPQTGAPTGNTELLQAFVNIPNMINPFDNNTHIGAKTSGGAAWGACTSFDCATGNGSTPLTGPANSINVSVPWIPSQENVGFPIPLSGTHEQVRADGSARLHGRPRDLPRRLRAVGRPKHRGHGWHASGSTPSKADDFLGEVFLCQDLGTYGTSSGDFIGTAGPPRRAHVRHGRTRCSTWLTQHPGLQDTCNVIVQYSEYDNYLDYIASLSAGVALGISQGAGYGRIVDAWVFDPTHRRRFPDLRTTETEEDEQANPSSLRRHGGARDCVRLLGLRRGPPVA